MRARDGNGGGAGQKGMQIPGSQAGLTRRVNPSQAESSRVKPNQQMSIEKEHQILKSARNTMWTREIRFH